MFYSGLMALLLDLLSIDIDMLLPFSDKCKSVTTYIILMTVANQKYAKNAILHCHE